jgi:hypothetical protein
LRDLRIEELDPYQYTQHSGFCHRRHRPGVRQQVIGMRWRLATTSPKKWLESL